jgi:hypothetical protein
MKAKLVNWLPWSVLKISGQTKPAIASSSAATQKSASRVFENARTALCDGVKCDLGLEFS